jgi:hypothetical protein
MAVLRRLQAESKLLVAVDDTRTTIFSLPQILENFTTTLVSQDTTEPYAPHELYLFKDYDMGSLKSSPTINSPRVTFFLRVHKVSELISKLEHV